MQVVFILVASSARVSTSSPNPKTQRQSSTRLSCRPTDGRCDQSKSKTPTRVKREEAATPWKPTLCR